MAVFQIFFVSSLFFCLVLSCPYINKRSLKEKSNHLRVHQTAFVGTFTCDYLARLCTQETCFIKITGNSPFCKKTNGAPLTTDASKVFNATVYIEQEFLNLYPKDEIGIGKIVGLAVRLPFHDAAEFDQNTNDKFGPDGCLSTSPDNSGMVEADSIVNNLFEPIWQKYCDQISRGDFWALIAAIAMENADPTKVLKIPRKWGRVDAIECDIQKRLPDPIEGSKDTKRVFVDQMGLTMDDAGILINIFDFLNDTHPSFVNFD